MSRAEQIAAAFAPFLGHCDRDPDAPMQKEWAARMVRIAMRDLDVTLAAQEGERPIHAAQDGDLDRHACELIAATAGCDGINAVATWHALQPFIGHLIREAQEGERPLTIKQCGWCAQHGHTTDEHNSVRPEDQRPPPAQEGERVAQVAARDIKAALSDWCWKDEEAPSLSATTQWQIARFIAGWLDSAGALAKHDAELLDGLEQRLSAAYDENPWGKFRSGLGRAIRILRVYRADRIEGQPSTEGEPS